MFFFKKRKDDELRSPSGLGAVLHKTVMFVTYPFRKPVYLALMLVLVLAAVAAVPLYYGAEPQEVHTWYLDKIRKVKNADFSKVSDKFSKLIDNIPALAPTPDKGTDRLVEVAPSQREIRRQMFKAASGARPQRVDILAEEADDVVALTPPAPQMPVEEEKQPSVPAAADERLSAGEDALFESKPVIVKKVSEAEGDVCVIWTSRKKFRAKPGFTTPTKWKWAVPTCSFTAFIPTRAAQEALRRPYFCATR